MKKMLETMKKDFWVILLDIVVVNGSYFFALLIRFYVNFQLRPVAMETYLPAWISFTPWYTIISILIFAGWKLYGGLWRYAGINDMNRIILANLCTAVFHAIGSIVFVTRMPVTYYIIGALLQFGFIVLIRFSYRVLLVEKKKISARHLGRQRCIVVGNGEKARRVVKTLEESEAYQPVAIYTSGRQAGTIDGIPIINKLELENVNAIFVADQLLSVSERTRIKDTAEIAGVEFHDYTGYFSNLGGHLSLTELLSAIKDPLKIELDGKTVEYETGAEALRALPDRYEVKSIEGNIVIKLERAQEMDKDAAIKAAYAAVMGEEAGGGA